MNIDDYPQEFFEEYIDNLFQQQRKNLDKTVIEFLEENGYKVFDYGVFTEESADYPLIAKEVAKNVVSGEYEKGILICGTGVGMCISANKIKGIRAVVCSDTTTAKFSRLHNDTNILCFGQRIIGESLAKDICKIWLDTPFESGRHLKRINLID